MASTSAQEEYEALFGNNKPKHKIVPENFLKLDPEVVAQQLTYLDYLMFSQIDFRALISARGIT